MWIVPRWTAACSRVLAWKSAWSACQTISTMRPASWTASPAQISIREYFRRDMLPPPRTTIVPDCATFPGTGAGTTPGRGDGMDFEVTYTEEQQRFRREVRAWLETNVPASVLRTPTSAEDNYRRYLELRDLGRKLGAKGWL